MGRATPLRIEQDELSSGIEEILSDTPANADVASEGVRTHTRLRLVAGGDADERTQKPQIPETTPEKQKFHIVGIDRVPMPDGLWTIVRGIVNGKPQAVVLNAANPPEFMLPTEPASESRGLLSRLSRSFLGKVLFALGGVVAAAACAPSSSGNMQGDGGISKGEYGTYHAAITSADADNLGPPTLIPGSTWGDQHPNIAEIGGQKVLTFSRADGQMWYVDCADLADCLATGVGAPDLISGLPAVPGGQTRRGAIFQDGGGDKIAYTTGGTVVWRAISYGLGGTLEAPVVGGALAPPMSTQHFGHMKIAGESHITWNSGSAVGDRNMITGVDTATGMTGAGACGVPHQDGAGVAIGSKYIDLGGGVYRCHLIQAPTLADLAASVNFINSQNVLPGPVIVNRLVNPRVFGNYLIYARYDENPPGSGNWEPRMYYAVVQEYCGNGVCAGGEDSVSCPGDCPPPPAEVCDNGVDDDGDGDTDCDDPDCVGGPACVPPGDDDAGPGDDDSGVPDGGDDDSGVPGDDDSGVPGDDDSGVPGDDDGGPGDDDSGVPGDDDGGGDDDSGVPGDDDGGDDDGGDDDSGTPPGACDFAEARITITEGECNLDKCADPFVDVVGACTFEVDLGNENPVTVEIDGRYGFDFLENAGAFLGGSYKVIDRGNGMDTVTGNLVTGVVGTVYGGDLNQEGTTYHVYCEEGRITISYNGEVIATLEAGQEQTFDLKNPVPEAPDAGPGDAQPPDDGGGCSCSIKGGSESNAATAGMLLLLAVALMRRKREKKA